MNEQTRNIAKQAFDDSKANGWELVVFWQDHFYARGRRFGYPVCIQLQNIEENHVERSHLVHFSSWKDVCQVWVDEIAAYIDKLEAEWVAKRAEQVGQGES